MILESLVSDAATHLWDNWDDVLTGATIFAGIAHLVQTFPTPNNKYAQWVLGGVQWFVGQRLRGSNTMQGEGTLTKQVPRDTVNPPAKVDAPIQSPKEP